MDFKQSFRVALSASVILGGVWVLYSYWLNFFAKNNSKQLSYTRHDAWIGFPMGYRYYCIVLQVLAALGFCATIILCLRSPPTAGFLADSCVVFPFLMTSFLVASGAWAYFVKSEGDPTVLPSFLCLVVAAVSSVLILGGLAEDSLSGNENYWKIIAWSFLCLTTVLFDGVAYAARLVRGTRV